MPPDAVPALPDDVVRRVHERLGDVDAAVLLRRAGTRIADIRRLLGDLYGERVGVDDLTELLLSDVIDRAAERAPALRDLDRARERDPGWFQREDMIGYVTYVDRFAGTLTALRDRLDYLTELGTTYLHLMPVLAPREGENDGGYAVADYDRIDPRLGTMAQLSALADDLHARDMTLCIDLVLNHTAREHPWAQAARDGDPFHRGYYIVFPDRAGPDAFERTTPDIFPTLAPGTFTWDDDLAGWVWTTFREFQWDLDYRNPDVFRAMLGVILELANRGVDVLRLDAAPFLWKRLGTDCMNQPEAHLILQAYRALLSIAAPGVLLKAEAMVAPEILPGYLGHHDDGVHAECDLAYDNQLMVMLWSTLATGDSTLARQALSRRRPAPSHAEWVTYVRCHDDIGWAVSDADAAAVGLDGAAHRAFLSRFYAGDEPGWGAAGVPFQPSVTGAAPTSGTAAALCGLDAAVAHDDGPAIATALRRLEAIYSVVYSFGGIPLLYMGDELALRNDEHWADDPAHAGDNRWLHRPRMDWSSAAGRHGDGPSAHAFTRLVGLARARRSLGAMAAHPTARVLDVGTPGVLAYRRGAADPSRADASASADGGSAETDGVLALVDVSGRGSHVAADVLHATGVRAGDASAVLHSGADGAVVDATGVTLPPYGFAWLALPAG